MAGGDFARGVHDALLLNMHDASAFFERTFADRTVEGRRNFAGQYVFFGEDTGSFGTVDR